MISKEALLAYYSRLAELHGDSLAEWHATVRLLDDLTPGTPQWAEVIAERVPKAVRLVSLQDLADPLAGRSFSSMEGLDSWMVAHGCMASRR